MLRAPMTVESPAVTRRPPTSVKFDDAEWRILERFQERYGLSVSQLVRLAVRRLGQSGIELSLEDADADRDEEPAP